MLATVHVAPGTFFAIIAASAVAATIAAVAGGRGVVIPVVVLELLLGVLLGPQLLGLHVNQFIQFFSDLGLGLLFFFAGYEIDINRIIGQPLRLGLIGWLISLALAYAIGGALAATGIVLSLLYTGSALATTAIGTLIPILSDAGELRTRFGTYLLAAGAVGEFGLFLVVRGTPALLLYRDALGARDRAALALMTSTQLPLVLAITTLATTSDHMRPSTAAALIGAAVLSTLIFPLVGLRLRGDAAVAAEGA